MRELPAQRWMFFEQFNTVFDELISFIDIPIDDDFLN